MVSAEPSASGTTDGCHREFRQLAGSACTVRRPCSGAAARASALLPSSCAPAAGSAQPQAVPRWCHPASHSRPPSAQSSQVTSRSAGSVTVGVTAAGAPPGWAASGWAGPSWSRRSSRTSPASRPRSLAQPSMQATTWPSGLTAGQDSCQADSSSTRCRAPAASSCSSRLWYQPASVGSSRATTTAPPPGTGANSQTARSSGLTGVASPASGSTRHSRRKPAPPASGRTTGSWSARSWLALCSGFPEVRDAASAPGSAASTVSPASVQATCSAKAGSGWRGQADGGRAGSATITVLPASSCTASANRVPSGAKARLVSGTTGSILAGWPPSGPCHSPVASPARPGRGRSRRRPRRRRR